MANQNVLTLAADNNSRLLPLLRSDPTLASSQDAHGYSLMHAAASYNHLDLLRTLFHEFHVDPNIKDEDGETALFVAEYVETAQVLLEELKVDPTIKNSEGETAEQKIQSEGDFTTVAEYLMESRVRGASSQPNARANGVESHMSEDGAGHPPPLPPNVKVHVGTLEDEQSLGEVADPELKRRIEELAARDDFQGEEGQMQLRNLITDAIKGVGQDERDVRQRRE